MLANFLVAESRFASRELAGLSETVEIFAIDPPKVPTNQHSTAPFGKYWQGHLEDVALPQSIGLPSPPEEGGLLLRPLRSDICSQDGLWTVNTDRMVQIPPRTCHLAANLPRPSAVSNELFIELRYAQPPCLIVNFDFADLLLGVFRAFAVPMKEGGAMLRIILALDPDAVADVFCPCHTVIVRRRMMPRGLNRSC